MSGGRPGILEVRGDSAAPAYWRQHARTQQTMRGEWVVTGDLYRVDEDGFYWYEGRADDMIKVGGEWVSPIEMENTLLAHPSVQEVAVVGISVDGMTRIRAVDRADAGHSRVGRVDEPIAGLVQRAAATLQVSA